MNTIWGVEQYPESNCRGGNHHHIQGLSSAGPINITSTTPPSRSRSRKFGSHQAWKQAPWSVCWMPSRTQVAAWHISWISVSLTRADPTHNTRANAITNITLQLCKLSVLRPYHTRKDGTSLSLYSHSKELTHLVDQSVPHSSWSNTQHTGR